MWRDLPFDLLANIFYFLSPDSLACARSTCRQWQNCAKTRPLSHSKHYPDWFMALPNRSNTQFCYAHNPISKNWYSIPIDFLPGVGVGGVKPLGSVKSLILFRTTSLNTYPHLLLCNPFTKEYKQLPKLNMSRTNPAVGLIALDDDDDDDDDDDHSFSSSFPSFKVYVAGGMSDSPTSGCSAYESTLEMYDSHYDTWQIVGSLPMEFAVRLTVWTPNDNVYCNGVMYWITSARAYSLMGFDISSNTWRELRVPMASELEFASIVLRNEKLTLVGGTCGDCASVWELGQGDTWVLVGKVPFELKKKFLGEKGSWVSTKCVSSNGAIYLYRDLESGMIVWKEKEEEEKGKWEWFWNEGCSSVRGRKVPNLQIKGVIFPPNLSPSCFF
ncbi:F-box/kelch-repeat protein At5g15710-like [Cannabis sativa]|uniref:F-box/kelch-repeat protein At5g15710-like n=1 Tax=Cannabis sativa TaxID=3483 RepID=UPI0029CA7EAF|nr:F-box/kelch-repeat protein At5g15710-like [Cannabis sativa]